MREGLAGPEGTARTLDACHPPEPAGAGQPWPTPLPASLTADGHSGLVSSLLPLPVTSSRQLQHARGTSGCPAANCPILSHVLVLMLPQRPRLSSYALTVPGGDHSGAIGGGGCKVGDPGPGCSGAGAVAWWAQLGASHAAERCGAWGGVLLYPVSRLAVSVPQVSYARHPTYLRALMPHGGMPSSAVDLCCPLL